LAGGAAAFARAPPSVGSQRQACSGRPQLVAGCQEASGESGVGRPATLAAADLRFNSAKGLHAARLVGAW